MGVTLAVSEARPSEKGTWGQVVLLMVVEDASGRRFRYGNFQDR